MTERYSVNAVSAYLEFDDKDPEAVNEYIIDFSPLLDAGQQLNGTPTVDIEAAGNSESPLELASADEALVAVSSETGAPQVAVRFFLRNGTASCRYKGKIKATVPPDISPGLDRVLVKRFYVVVRPS